MTNERRSSAPAGEPVAPHMSGDGARAALHEVPERALRSLLLTLSRRRWLGDLATSVPVTRPMVGRFVAGLSLDEALATLASLRAQGMRTTVDVLGEAVTSAEDADAAVARYLQTLDALAERELDRNVSLKLSQMGLQIDRELCRDNVGRIFRRAAEVGAFVRIDMEDHTTVDATLGLWRELRRTDAASGVVIQAALRRSATDVEELIGEGAPVRLCKGAYKEPSDVAFQEKGEVDGNYERLMERLLHGGGYTALATHDERLIGRAVKLARADGIGRDRFEFQMLYGVRRDLQERLVRAGYTVRIYVPYGTHWYPYFMRRLAERPANVTFILRSLLREGSTGSPVAGAAGGTSGDGSAAAGSPAVDVSSEAEAPGGAPAAESTPADASEPPTPAEATPDPDPGAEARPRAPRRGSRGRPAPGPDSGASR